MAEGLALDLDTEGYDLPTAIAFVPRPGPGPKDPLYFVTELRGRVKVVTNDRSVHTFAEGFVRSEPLEELPNFAGETGLAGICLAPDQGYVFVTFAYRDSATRGDSSGAAGRPRMASGRATRTRQAGGVLRNDVVRFETAPGTFSLKPHGRRAFTELFAGYEAAISHQVGGCQVAGDLLYVSVADGWQTAQSQRINSLLGKVLRLTLDGQPAPGNPFRRSGDTGSAAAFVWAYGLRNPFSLKAVGNRLFAADNGLEVDRFLEVYRGENYLWDGTDWSIGSRAVATLFPDVAPAQLEYYPGGLAWLPREYAGSFFMAASNVARAGVLRLQYSLETGKPVRPPEYLLRYRGGGTQLVTGVAAGPDGLYFVPTMPDAGGRSAVLKVRHDPGRAHPYLLTASANPEALMEEKGCFGCHAVDGLGGGIGPSLDQESLIPRLEARLESEEYGRALRELDRLDEEPFRRFRPARAEVARASGREKLRSWMIHRIMEPRFDDPQAQMPNLGVTEAEAAVIADHLLRRRPLAERWIGALPEWLRPDPLLYRHLLLAFAGGLALGAFAVAAVPRAGRAWKRKRRRGP